MPVHFQPLCAPTAFKPRCVRSAAGRTGRRLMPTRGGFANSVLPSRSPRGFVRSAANVERGARSSQYRG